MTVATKQRRIPLEEKFFKYDVDDMVYGYLQWLATFHPKEEKLYVKLDKVSADKKLMADIAGCTTKTITRHINTLKAKGYVQEQLIDGIMSYIFPYNIDNPYKLIDYELLGYLIHTKSKFSVKIYIFLLDKFEWKVNSCGGQMYEFTQESIWRAFGYSHWTPSIGAAINNCLEDLERTGIIKLCNFYITTSEGARPRIGLIDIMKKKEF